MAEFKFNVLKFALAGGILVALCFALMTLASILNIPGFPESTSLLVQFYGGWGYSVSWLGILVGAVWGFAEGFIHLGLLAWIYNKLVK